MKKAQVHDYISFELEFLNGERELVQDQVLAVEKDDDLQTWYRTRKNWLVNQAEVQQVNARADES